MNISRANHESQRETYHGARGVVGIDAAIAARDTRIGGGARDRRIEGRDSNLVLALEEVAQTVIAGLSSVDCLLP